MSRATPTPSCSASSNAEFVQKLSKVEGELAQIKKENQLLRMEVDALKKWKTGLESWLRDGFSLVASGSIVNY